MKKYGDLRDRFICLREAWERQVWLEKPSNKAYDFIWRCKGGAPMISWPQIAASFEREHGPLHEAAYFERLWRKRKISNQKVKAKKWLVFLS
jgi:hypothetical protein